MPVLTLEPAEADLVLSLAGQVRTLLDPSGAPNAGAPNADTETRLSDDPALARLLPDAYADPEASLEFRRFTASDLTGQKMANLDRVTADIRSAGAERRGVTLDGDATGAWLRVLTDLRLVLAARLEMDADGTVARHDRDAGRIADVYDWLGYLQESIIDSLEG